MVASDRQMFDPEKPGSRGPKGFRALKGLGLNDLMGLGFRVQGLGLKNPARHYEIQKTDEAFQSLTLKL